MKAIHKKVVMGVWLVAVCTLAAMVITSAGLWIYGGEDSWRKVWERGSLSLLFYVLFVIESIFVGFCTRIDEVNKTKE